VGRLTWTVGRTQIVRPWKELDPRLVHIGRMGLVIKGCSEDPLAQYAAVAGPYALPEWLRHNLRRGVSLLQREGRLGSAMRRRPQAPRNGCGGLDSEQDWTDHRPISRPSVKLRNAGDCMTNKCWLDDPAAITGGAAFARTVWKHMSNLRAAFCCEKIGV
jgi:hypothetical protein